MGQLRIQCKAGQSGGRVIHKEKSFSFSDILFFQSGLVSGWATEGSPCRLAWQESGVSHFQILQSAVRLNAQTCNSGGLMGIGSPRTRFAFLMTGLLWTLLALEGGPFLDVVACLVYKGCSRTPRYEESYFQKRPSRGWASIPPASWWLRRKPPRGPMNGRSISSFLLQLYWGIIDIQNLHIFNAYILMILDIGILPWYQHHNQGKQT